MRLFTVGPVEMFDEIKAVRRGTDVPYFRTKEFSDLMLDTDRLLKKFAGTAESSETIYLTASGTGAMEAAVLNCFTPSDRLLVVNGGTFGQRFVDICALHGIPHAEIRLAFGEVLEARHFEEFENDNFTGLLINIDETSTGQLYDIRLISDFCRRKKMCLMVDAISSFLCDPLNMDESGIDVMIASSQKGACISPGLSMVVLNRRTLEERVMKDHVRPLYFDFRIYVENFKRGQTPFTPAVGICLELQAAMHLIERKGLDKHLQDIAEVARDFRERVRSLPVDVPKYPLSNAITPIIFREDIAYKVFEVLKDRYDIMVNPTGGALHEKALRIAHIGQTTKADNAMLLAAIEKAIADVKGVA